MKADHCKNVCALLLAALSFHASAADVELGQDDFAVVTVHGYTACAAIAKAGVTSGTAITIVLPGTSQKVIPGMVEREATTECNSLEKADLPRPYYLVRMEKESPDPFDIGILVVRAFSTFRQIKGTLIASFNGKNLPYGFRQCASQEGLHLFVSRAANGKMRPIWHTYYYLGYDTVPTCTSRDVKVMKTFNMSLNTVAPPRITEYHIHTNIRG